MAINIPMNESETLDINIENVSALVGNHSVLSHRSDADQHPIGAITNLQGTLDNKVDKVTGKGLSTNDYTDAEKTKLAGIETGAEVNVQSDWSQSDSTADDYIKNKPSIPPAQVNADWNATSGVAEILNKPTIPTKTSDLTNDSGYITKSVNNLDNYTKSSDLSEVATSGDYNDLTNKPTIPTKTSQLQNDSGFLTEHQSLANYDTKAEVNSKIATATNDMATETWVEEQGYLTEHQSLSAYRTSADQDTIDTAMQGDIDTIEEKIPSQATAQNQLADKNFVNSSIATETAHYISNNGQPFNSVAELEAYTGTVTNNDYAFVTGTDEQGNSYYDRYKASVSGSTVTWAKEYRLNNSSFTAQQWASISSGITASDKTKLDGIESGADVTDSANVKSAGATMGVKVAGTELVKDSDGKVNIHIASGEDLGIIKTTSYYGIYVNPTTGLASLQQAGIPDINSKEQDYRPITPYNLDYAILKGLESNSQITTTAQKKAICNTIGAEFGGQFELIEEITLTEDVGAITRTQTPASYSGGVKDYNFKKIAIYAKTPTTQEVNPYALWYIYDENNRPFNFVDFAFEQNKYFGAYAEINNGKFDGWFAANIWFTTHSVCYKPPYSAYEFASGNIKKLWFNISGQNQYQAGTTIKIYGVWA